MPVCKICNKNFKKLSVHIRIHDMSPKYYYDKFCKKENEGICKCGKETKFHGVGKGYSRYCSIECFSADEEYKKEVSERNTGRRRTDMEGGNNPAKRKEAREKISEAHKGKEYSQEARKKQSDRLKGVNKGKTYEEIYGPETAKILKEKRREKLEDGQAIEMCIKAGGNKISKPQLKLFEVVKSLYEEALLEYKILNYSLDIAIPSLKVGIEYDCSYWHNEEKDNRRDKRLEENGWCIIRFKDYIPDIEEITNKIEEVS